MLPLLGPDKLNHGCLDVSATCQLGLDDGTYLERGLNGKRQQRCCHVPPPFGKKRN